MTNLYPNPLQPHRAPFNRHQLRLLNERCPVRVIAPMAWTDEWRLKRSSPRRVTLDGITVDHPRYWFPPKICRSYYGHCYRWSVRKTFARAVQEFQPELVFAPWAYPDGWAAVKLAREFNLKVVVQVHGSDVKLLDDFPARKARTIEALTGADGVIAVSQDLAKDVKAFGVKNGRVIYDGVDPALFHTGSQREALDYLNLDSREKHVLFVGNLVPVKSVHTLIVAMKDIQARLVIIGDGPLRDSLEKLAKDLGIAHRVQFMGALPLEDLPTWYQAADLFVLPSRSEGVPNVLLEASACGLPWIASYVGGIPEIKLLGARCLIEPGSVLGFAHAIQLVLDLDDRMPPTSPIPPRLRTEAVAELQAFLEETLR